MQHMDFSHRIHKNYIPEDVTAIPMDSAAGKTKNKSGFPILTIVAALTFTLGVIVGLKITDVTNIEKNIVKYPESKKKIAEKINESSSFANPSLAAARPEDAASGKFLIKIGTFSESSADTLTSKLNNNAKLVQIKPTQCSGVDENIPNRYIAFRTRAGSAGQNVFLGCFEKKWQAQNALKIVKDSQIPGTGSSQIYEIE
jgi:hypothetical protein